MNEVSMKVHPGIVWTWDDEQKCGLIKTDDGNVCFHLFIFFVFF